MCNITRRRALTVGVLLITGMTGACTPAFNWREMPAADGVVIVAFPARPQTETRTLPVAGVPVPFTLTVAQVDGATFAVGHLVLPAAIAASDRDRYRAALEDSLARNLQATERTRRDVQIRAAGHSTRPSVPAHELEFAGSPGGEPAWLLARVVLVGERLIQVAALGTRRTLSEENARIFIDSVRMQ